jgi:hypothetical protein
LHHGVNQRRGFGLTFAFVKQIVVPNFDYPAAIGKTPRRVKFRRWKNGLAKILSALE